MDELIRVINNYPNGTIIIVKWENELVLKGKIDTIYETDNGLEMDVDGYKEFFACALEILDILKNPQENILLGVGELTEISMENTPVEIMLEGNLVIWNET